MFFKKIRVIHKRDDYVYYGLELPPEIGHRWSGARIAIQDDGNTLTIKKVFRIN